MIKRGTICWVALDPSEGAEIGKTRPAVVMSNDINNELADTLTVIPVTKSKDRIYPFEVFIPKGIGNLKNDSKAKANQIRTIDKKRITGVVGELPKEWLLKIEGAIKIHLYIK